MRSLQMSSVKIWAPQVALVVKNSPTNAGDVRDTGFHPHVRKIPWRKKWRPTPIWEIPWTEEPGGLQSMGSQRVRRDWSDLARMQWEWRISWIQLSIFKQEELFGSTFYQKIFARSENWKLQIGKYSFNVEAHH